MTPMTTRAVIGSAAILAAGAPAACRRELVARAPAGWKPALQR